MASRTNVSYLNRKIAIYETKLSFKACIADYVTQIRQNPGITRDYFREVVMQEFHVLNHEVRN